MKTHILTLAKTFPAKHPRHGEPTYFKERLMRALFKYYYGIDVIEKNWIYPEEQHKFLLPKPHTIRGNYDRMKKIVDEVNRGEAVLSLREWSGVPYRSPQEEIEIFTKDDGLGVQKLEWKEMYPFDGKHYTMVIDGKFFDDYAWLANNDGLALENWRAWFKGADLSEPMAIIQFTDFRYC